MLTQRPETQVEAIARLARERNKAGLKYLINQGICLSKHELFSCDEGKTYYQLQNPVMLLARSGDADSVEFLIDNFMFSYEDAAVGYLLGGHVELFNATLAKKITLNTVIMIAAYLGLFDQVDRLLQKSPSNISDAVKGYALGGYIEEVNAKRSMVADPDRSKFVIVQSYATRGWVNLVNAEIENGADPCPAIIGYAMSGYIAEAKNQAASHPAGNLFLMVGYIGGNHTYLWKKLLESNLDDPLLRQGAIQSFASLGNTIELDELNLTPDEREIALRFLVIHSHISGINIAVAKGANRVAAVEVYDSSSLTKENIFLLAAHIDDERLRVMLLNQASKFDQTVVVEHIPNKVKKVRSMMDEYQLNPREALSLTKSDFKAWLIVGSNFMTYHNYPAEIFIRITALVGSLANLNSAATVFDASIEIRRKLGLFPPLTAGTVSNDSSLLAHKLKIA